MSLQLRKFQALDRRRKAVALYAEGRSQQEIAELLGVDRGTVSRDITVMRDEWKKSARRDYQDLCNRELLRLQLLETEAWDNWEWENAVVAETGEKRRGSKSRWKYLEVIVRCSAQRRRLLALDGLDLERRPKVPPAEQAIVSDELERLLAEIREMEASQSGR